jgi:hypothetical protein
MFGTHDASATPIIPQAISTATTDQVLNLIDFIIPGHPLKKCLLFHGYQGITIFNSEQ